MRISARAILINSAGQLVLINRIKPGHPPYWTTPGGGVEETDASIEAALIRELAEELGITITRFAPAITLTSDSNDSVQHFFVAHTATTDIALSREDKEFSDSTRGEYRLTEVDLREETLLTLNIKPQEIKNYILENRDLLLNN